MITEDYVSLEVAKLLKNKGFREKCIATYNLVTKNFVIEEVYQDWTTRWGEAYVSAPTLQMTIKWLRGVHNIHINLDVHYLYFAKALGWMYTITKVLGNGVDYVESKGDENDKTFYSNYKEACEGAIRYCLENLI